MLEGTPVLEKPNDPDVISGSETISSITSKAKLESRKATHPATLFPSTAESIAATKSASLQTISSIDSENATVTETTVEEVSADTSPEQAVKLLYSYKDYSPAPVIAYTRNEDEADELVQTLKG